MTASDGHAFTFPRRDCRARVMHALEKKGRRECRAPGSRPQPRVQNKKHTSVVTAVTPDRSGIPRASGFNGFLRDLLGEPGFLATVASHDALGIVANLISASGYRDHTTSPSACRQRSSAAAKASTASRTQRP